MALKLHKGKSPAPQSAEQAPAEEIQTPTQIAIANAKAGVDRRQKSRKGSAVYRGLMRTMVKNNTVNMALVILIAFVIMIFLLGLFRDNTGNFTIRLDKLDVRQYGIELSNTSGFDVSADRLEADMINGATNISINDLPAGLDELDGSNNGANYIAYTFYVRNNGTKPFSYNYVIDVKETTKNVDEAIRLGLYYNGADPITFAKRPPEGGAEEGTTPFVSGKVIDGGLIRNLEVGGFDKYTVVIWIEGSDPQCTDALLGGTIRMAMSIDVVPEE